MDPLQLDDSDSDMSSMSSIPEGSSYTAPYYFPRTDEVHELSPIRRYNRCTMMAKRFLPHLALFLMLIGYILLGAAVIHAIEGANEPAQRDVELRSIFDLRDRYQEHMWNIVRSQTRNSRMKISQKAFNSINQEYFDALAKNIFKSYKSQLVNENHLTNSTKVAEQLWTYSNSIFFATTVITTIGYGTLVPSTTLGRIVTIIFALFGIPLLRITIDDIGCFLAELFSILYRLYNSIKQKIRKWHPRRRRQSASSDASTTDSFEEALRIPIFTVFFVLLPFTAIGGFLFQTSNESNYSEGLFSSFSVIATIGFTDTAPTTLVHMLLTIVWVIVGLSMAHMCLDLASRQYVRKIQLTYRRVECSIADYLEKIKNVKSVAMKKNDKPAPQAV